MFENNLELKAIGNEVYQWLFFMWARDIVIAIRRELDDDHNTVCLGRLLDEMAQRPEVITRRRFLNGISKDDFKFKMLSVTFDSHGVVKAQDTANDYLDPAGITSNRKHLMNVAKPALDYANRLIAHRSEIEKVAVTLGDVNRSVDEIETVFRKYYAIINGPALVGLEPSMIGDWTEPFRIPWVRPEPKDDE